MKRRKRRKRRKRLKRRIRRRRLESLGCLGWELWPRTVRRWRVARYGAPWGGRAAARRLFKSPGQRATSIWDAFRWLLGAPRYGQLLTTAELRLWRAQDQEGTKADGNAGPSVRGLSMFEAREEAVEWRESLREHFREPMHCEVREKLLNRLTCMAMS